MLVCGMFVEFQCQPMAIIELKLYAGWVCMANVQGLTNMQVQALVVTMHIGIATSVSSTPACTTQKTEDDKKVAYYATEALSS